MAQMVQKSLRERIESHPLLKHLKVLDEKRFAKSRYR
jgi:hypothetical protein